MQRYCGEEAGLIHVWTAIGGIIDGRRKAAVDRRPVAARPAAVVSEAGAADDANFGARRKLPGKVRKLWKPAVLFRFLMEELMHPLATIFDGCDQKPPPLGPVQAICLGEVATRAF